ncbi:MAG: hypothetical protein IMF19_14130, partial [Proteobacteria bacterium]|nr:hypothetical protein [Pseudomonadota bacterium]
MTVAENDSGKGISKRTYIITMAIPVGVSILALLCTPVVFDYIFPGEVRPLPPSGFFVVRGIYEYNSDHIVFPIDWENTGAKATLIMHPKLI